jgi:hypothetical protein
VEQGPRGAVLVRDLERKDLIYMCRPDDGELVVITLWEEGDDPLVPKRFTDALRSDDHRVADRPPSDQGGRKTGPGDANLE